MSARASAPTSSGTSTVMVPLTWPTLSRVVHGPGPSLEGMGVRWRTLMAGVTVGGALLASGCGTFTAQPEDWRPQSELTPQAAPDPEPPGDSGGGGGQGKSEQAKPSHAQPPARRT